MRIKREQIRAEIEEEERFGFFLRQAAVTFHHDIQMKEGARADTAILSVPASLRGCVGRELLQPQQTERAVHQPQHMARSSALRTVNKHQREMWTFLLRAQIGEERINQPPIGSELCCTAQDDARQLRFRFYIFCAKFGNTHHTPAKIKRCPINTGTLTFL